MASWGDESPHVKNYMEKPWLLSQPNNINNSDNKTTKTGVGSTQSSRWEPTLTHLHPQTQKMFIWAKKNKNQKLGQN